MKRTLIMALFALVLASACSEAPRQPSLSLAPASPSVGQTSPSEPSSDTQPRKIDPRQGGFEVGFGEFAVAPEAKAIRPGRVTFVVRNGGTLTHGFELESEEDSGSSSGKGRGEDRFKIEEPLFGAGETIKVTVDLPAGFYKIKCYVGDHEERGMQAFITVKEGAPLVRATSAPSDGVAIEGFAFSPATIEVPVGTEVTWKNNDPAQHTVTAKDGSFGSDPLASGAAFAVPFDQPGEFAYFCAIHPTMTGTVRVVAG